MILKLVTKAVFHYGILDFCINKKHIKNNAVANGQLSVPINLGRDNLK